MAHDKFEVRILSEFLPLFCNHPERKYEDIVFTSQLGTVDGIDAQNFLDAIDSGLVELRDKLYFAPLTGHGEQLFNEGAKVKSPRPISLAMEVVISIATTIRLSRDYGWPRELIGTQSKGSAFDVMTFPSSNTIREYIACEVKTTKSDTDKLVLLMQSFGADPSAVGLNDVAKNALNKVKALRDRRPPIFWALAPGGYGKIFNMQYMSDGSMQFKVADTEILRYPGAEHLLKTT